MSKSGNKVAARHGRQRRVIAGVSIAAAVSAMQLAGADSALAYNYRKCAFKQANPPAVPYYTYYANCDGNLYNIAIDAQSSAGLNNYGSSANPTSNGIQQDGGGGAAAFYTNGYVLSPTGGFLMVTHYNDGQYYVTWGS